MPQLCPICPCYHTSRTTVHQIYLHSIDIHQYWAYIKFVWSDGPNSPWHEQSFKIWHHGMMTVSFKPIHLLTTWCQLTVTWNTCDQNTFACLKYLPQKSLNDPCCFIWKCDGSTVQPSWMSSMSTAPFYVCYHISRNILNEVKVLKRASART